jgi:hypothetical protein
MPSMGSEFLFTEALVLWLWVVLGLVFAVLVIVVLGSLVAFGPTGPVRVLEILKIAAVDWIQTSPRRVWAVATLTMKEAIRRKALLVGVVFAVLFLFAGWFLAQPANDPEQQVKVYVSFVMRVILFLLLPMMLFLACWGIPEDIRVRSLHTVVTKPVRRQEIVLGRILGFKLIGLLLLVIMGTVGYVWILRQMGPTGRSQLVARVPVYGSVSFKDREGLDKDRGINTGDEWMFRSFIEGASKARMIWHFKNIDVARLETGDSLNIEAGFQVFRSYKGNMDRGIGCQLAGINPQTGRRAILSVITERDASGKVVATDNAFDVKEFRENNLQISRTLLDEDGKELDLFKDLVANGELKVEALCLSPQQYLGSAGPDLFIRMPDRPFVVSYVKGLMGIGLMMTMTIVMGVSVSTFVKGPVATMLTFFLSLVGWTARPFVDTIVDGRWVGGGMCESVYRILKHLNPTTDLPNNLAVTLMRGVDSIFVALLRGVRYVFPDFQYFDLTPYVAYGFDVPWAQATPPNSGALLPSLAITAGYVLPWIIVGYFALRLRELEAK